MSRIDAYEAQRGPVRRRYKHRPVDRKRAKKEVQFQMQLYGGATKKEIKEGEPFNDEIPF